MAVGAAAVAAVGAIYSGYVSQQQAKAQIEAQERNNELAAESMLNQYSELSEAEKDSRNAALEQTQENQEEYQRRKSRINLITAASGAGGMSVDSMMQDLRANKGSNMNAIVNNQEIELDKFRSRSTAIQTQAKSRIDKRKIHKPSWGEIGLQAGVAAASAYAGGGGTGGAVSAPNSSTAPRGGQSYSGSGWSNQATGGV